MQDEAFHTQQIDKLQGLVGTWEGTTKTWFEPEKPEIVEKIAGSIQFTPIANFIEYEYESSLDGKPFQGKATFGYDNGTKKFQYSWIDSFHMGTAMMFSEGDATENGFSVLGSYIYEGNRWGWRTEIAILSTDEIVITAYNIMTEGEEEKALETSLKRIADAQ